VTATPVATPGPSAPAAPGQCPVQTPGAGPARPATPIGPVFSGFTTNVGGQDLLHWSHWWYLESARYLDLRTHVQGPPAPDGRTVLLTAPLAPSRNVVRTRVLPQLMQVATDATSPNVVSSALVAIGRLADPGELQSRSALITLRTRLDDSNAQVRESAILALGLFGSPEATRDLIDIVRETERGKSLTASTTIPARSRAHAAHALGLAATRTDDIGERQRIALELVALLEEDAHGRDDIPVAALCSLGLVDLGSRPHVPAKDLRDRDGLDHVLSSRGLSRYVATWVAKPRPGTSVRGTRARSHAAVAYARIAANADEGIRSLAVERLVAISGDRSEHVHVRTAATIALGEVARAGHAPADREARRHLLKQLRGGQPLERRFARIALATATARPGSGEDTMEGWSEVRNALTGELARSRSSDLAWTALAIGILEGGARDAGLETSSASTHALTTMAMRRKSDDDSAALGLGLAIAARGTDRAEAVAERVAKELDETTTPEMRGHLAIALGLLDHTASIDVLRADLVDARNQPLQMWSAAVALGLLGESVGNELVDALKVSSSSAQRIAITAALGQTGTARSVDPLLAVVADEGNVSPLRASAVDALAAICDLDRMPWRDPIAHAFPYFAATPTLNGNGSGLLERPW